MQGEFDFAAGGTTSKSKDSFDASSSRVRKTFPG
jgi:hypothetical protein